MREELSEALGESTRVVPPVKKCLVGRHGRSQKISSQVSTLLAAEKG
jgi:hypothetical protein